MMVNTYELCRNDSLNQKSKFHRIVLLKSNLYFKLETSQPNCSQELNKNLLLFY